MDKTWIPSESREHHQWVRRWRKARGENLWSGWPQFIIFILVSTFIYFNW